MIGVKKFPNKNIILEKMTILLTFRLILTRRMLKSVEINSFEVIGFVAKF